MRIATFNINGIGARLPCCSGWSKRGRTSPACRS